MAGTPLPHAQTQFSPRSLIFFYFPLSGHEPPSKKTMVRLAGFASINVEEERLAQQKIQETIEAQEARVIDEYERGLREVAASNLDDAEVSK